MRRQLQPGDRPIRPETGRPVAFYQRPIGLDEPWQDERCGTYAGWNAHQQCHEEACRPCKSAHAKYMRELRIRTGKTRHVVSVTAWHREEAAKLAIMCI